MSSIIKILPYNISHYSYNLYSNNIPLINSLLLEVEPSEKISDFYGKDLCVTIKSTPELFFPYQRYISINADGRCDISDIELEIRSHSLKNITKSENCTIDIAVIDRNETFGTLSFTIDLLPYYCWSGFSFIPEQICTMVTPNQPEIEQIVSSAYTLLRERGELPITDGYEKKNIKKVYAVTRAIYDSIRKLKITYNITKTDYLSKYVFLQTCEMLMDRMIGSSLDISLVFAACLENLGLNPIIAIYRNHALVGCFLSDISLENPVTENHSDFHRMTKSTNKLLFLIEPTSMANGMSIDFENSCRMAKEYTVKNSDSFTALIDIKAARLRGVQPMPNRITENGIRRFEKKEHFFDDFFDNFVEINDENTDDTDRELARVKNEIFDISENNPLINTDFGNTIGLAYPSVDALPDFLSEQRLVLPYPCKIENNLSPEQLCSLPDTPETETQNGIVSFHSADKLKKLLNNISVFTNADKYYRYNTYVTLYYAKWQSPDSLNINYTPMFLFPCEVTEMSESCKIRLLNEKAILNPLFLELLNKLFTVNFSTLSKIPSREILNRREYIFTVIASAFSGKNKIKFIPYIALGAYEIFSFSDYNVLTKNALTASQYAPDIFMGNKINSPLIQSEPVNTDTIFPLSMPCPLELDHFQKSALHNALKNDISLISGGSNSGKTRIAANLIFNMLYSSKNVLYIGGTKSACEDIKDYLTQLNLDKYMLYVCPHSPELSGSFDVPPQPEKRPSNLYVQAQRLVQKKSDIAAYYNALHKKQGNGFNLYQTVMQYEKYKNAKFCVPFSPSYIKELDDDKVITAFRQISEIINAAKESGLPYRHPLLKIGRKNFSYEMKSQAVSLINSYKAALESFLDSQDEICELMYIDIELLREDQTDSLCKIAELLKNNSSDIPASVFRDSNCKELLKRIHSVIDNAEKRLVSSKQILELFSPKIFELNASELLEEYKNALSAFFIKRNGIFSKLVNILKKYLLDGKTISHDSLSDVLYSLVHYAKYNTAISAQAADFKELFGIDMFAQTISEETANLKKLRQIYSACDGYIMHIENICRRECEPSALLSGQADLVSSYNQSPDMFIRKFSEFKNHLHNFCEAESTFVKFLNVDIYSLKDKMSLKWYEYLYSWLTELEQSIDGLKSWCNYLNVRETALNMGLESAINLFENNQIDFDEFKQAFLKGFFKASCEYILSTEKVFADFSQASCVSSCEEIGELISELDNILIKDLQIKLQSDYRDYHNNYINDTEEKSYLDSKELDELFASNQKLMQKRFPVTVSYGSSIAKYISDDKFDCIIIDDAHAVPYYSLLPLLSHSTKTIFLGMNTYCDKVLFSAPSLHSLTSRKVSHASISLYSRLIQCGIPCFELSYKYGTRRDHAAFTGEVFASHSEHSVPYALPEEHKINIIPVNGVFDRRGTPINFAEASCVTENLKKLSPEQTTAVCAFTRAQANLIKDMWNALGIYNPNLRIYSINDYPSGCFDNVIVSTTFSNSNNTEAIPFCPTEVSSENYRLRLNYLLSSVCGNFTVITGLLENSLDSIEPYTDSLYALKRFIKFIYNRVTYTAPTKIRELDRNFIKNEICEFLQKLGYETVRNLGSSEIKIDVAVRNTSGNGFSLGILLDNYCGESSDIYTTEILMPDILKENGWNVIRIFTNEWYENYNKQLEKISDKLSQLK
ncbi:MAG: DUF4011 domain-containing protein [Clostridia bacterium]|nr:DUF4011 domain-containing protein [Clostridia bacterium]